MTTAFAVLSPVWFGIAILLGELGGYAETLLGHFAVVGVFAVVLSIATLVSFMFCLIVLRVTRLTIQVESTYP